MTPNNFREKANFIWQVADHVLRGAFKAHEYGDVILPFAVPRARLAGRSSHRPRVASPLRGKDDIAASTPKKEQE